MEFEAKTTGFDKIAKSLLRAVGGINSAVSKLSTQMNLSFKNLGADLGKNMADALVKAFEQKVTGIKTKITRSLPQSLVKQVRTFAISKQGIEPDQISGWMRKQTGTTTDRKLVEKYWVDYLRKQKEEELWLNQAIAKDAANAKLATKLNSTVKTAIVQKNELLNKPKSTKVVSQLQQRYIDEEVGYRNLEKLSKKAERTLGPIGGKETKPKTGKVVSALQQRYLDEEVGYRNLEKLARKAERTLGVIGGKETKALSIATIPLTADRIQTLKDRMEVEATGLYKTYTQKSIDIVKKVRAFNAKKQIIAAPTGGERGWFDTLFPKSFNDIDPFAIYPKTIQEKIKGYLETTNKTPKVPVRNPRAGQMGLIAPLAVGVLGALGGGIQMAGGMGRGAATAMSSGFGIPETQETNIMGATKDAVIGLNDSLKDLAASGWDMASYAADKFFYVLKMGTGIVMSMTGIIAGSAYVMKSWGQDILMTTERFRGYNIAMLGTLKTQSNVDQVMAASMKVAENLPIGYEQIISGTKAMTLISPLKTMFKDSIHLEENMKDVWDIVIALSQIEPEWGIQGALYSLRETLSGDFMSIKRRYEIPVDVMLTTDGKSLSSIKKDVPKLLKGLAGNLRDLVPAETLKLTAGQIGPVLQKIQGQFDVLKTRIGNMGFYDSFVSDVKKVQVEFETFASSINASIFAKRMSNAFQDGWEVVKEFVLKSTIAINNLFGTNFSIDLSSITDTIQSASEGLVNIFQYINGFIFSTAFQKGLKDTFQYLSDGVREFYEIAKVVIPKIGTILGDLLSKAKSLFDYIRSSTKGFISDVGLVEVALGVWFLGFGNIISVARSLLGVLGSIVAFRVPIVEIFTWLHKDLAVGGLTKMLSSLGLLTSGSLVTGLTNAFLMMGKSAFGIYSLFVLIPNLFGKVIEYMDLFENTGFGKAIDYLKDVGGVGTPSITYQLEKKDKEYASIREGSHWNAMLPESMSKLLLNIAKDPDKNNPEKNYLHRAFEAEISAQKIQILNKNPEYLGPTANGMALDAATTTFNRLKKLTSDITSEGYADNQRKINLRQTYLADLADKGDKSGVQTNPESWKTPEDFMKNVWAVVKEASNPSTVLHNVGNVVGVGKELLGVAKPMGDTVGEAIAGKIKSVLGYIDPSSFKTSGPAVNLSGFTQDTLGTFSKINDDLELLFKGVYDPAIYSANDLSHSKTGDHPKNLALDVQALSANTKFYNDPETFIKLAIAGRNSGLKEILLGSGLNTTESAKALKDAQSKNEWARNNIRFESLKEAPTKPKSIHMGFYGEGQGPVDYATQMARKADEEARKKVGNRPLITYDEILKGINSGYAQTQNDKAQFIKLTDLQFKAFTTNLQPLDIGDTFRKTLSTNENEKYGYEATMQKIQDNAGNVMTGFLSGVKEKLYEIVKYLSEKKSYITSPELANSLNTISPQSLLSKVNGSDGSSIGSVFTTIGTAAKTISSNLATALPDTLRVVETMFKDFDGYFMKTSELSKSMMMEDVVKSVVGSYGTVESQIQSMYEFGRKTNLNILRDQAVDKSVKYTPEMAAKQTAQSDLAQRRIRMETYRPLYDAIGEFGKLNASEAEDSVILNLAETFSKLENLKFPELATKFAGEINKIAFAPDNAGISIEDGITNRLKELKIELDDAFANGTEDDTLFKNLKEMESALKRFMGTVKKLSPFQSWQYDLERFNVELKGSDFRIPSVMKDLLNRAPTREAKTSVYGAIEKGLEQGQYSELEALQFGMGASAVALKNWREQMFDAGKTIVDGLSSSFETGFFDFMTGKLSNLNEMFRSMGRSILSTIGQIISKMMAVSATKMVFGIDLNTGASTGGGIANSIIGGLFGGQSQLAMSMAGMSRDQIDEMMYYSDNGASVKDAIAGATTGAGSKGGILGTLSSAWAGAKAFTSANPAVLPLSLLTGFLSQPGRLWGGAKDDTQAGQAAYQAASSSRETMLTRRNTDAEKYMMSGRTSNIGNFGFGSPTYSTWSSGDGWFKGPKENHSAADTTAFDASMKTYYDLLKTSAEESYNNTKRLNELKKSNEVAAIEQEVNYRKQYLATIQAMFVDARASGDFKVQDELRDKIWDMQTTIDDLITSTIDAYKTMTQKSIDAKKSMVSDIVAFTSMKFIPVNNFGKYTYDMFGAANVENQDKYLGQSAAATQITQAMSNSSNNITMGKDTMESIFGNLKQFLTPEFQNFAIFNEGSKGNAVVQMAMEQISSAIVAKATLENTNLNTASNNRNLYTDKDKYKDTFDEIKRIEGTIGMFTENDFQYGGAQAIADANLKISEYYTEIANQISSWVDAGYLSNTVETIANLSQGAFEALQSQVRQATYKTGMLGDMKGYDSWKDLQGAFTNFKDAGGDMSVIDGVQYKAPMDLGSGWSSIASGSVDPFTAYFDWTKDVITNKITSASKGSDAYFNAQEELFQLMLEKSEHLKAKSEDSMKALEDMLGAIGDTMKLRIAEEAKTSKGDIIFMDIRSIGDMAKEISNAIKNQDPKAAELVKELKRKLAGL